MDPNVDPNPVVFVAVGAEPKAVADVPNPVFEAGAPKAPCIPLEGCCPNTFCGPPNDVVACFFPIM